MCCRWRRNNVFFEFRPISPHFSSEEKFICNIALFIKENNYDRDGHGPQFHSHMHRINKKGGYNISVYHEFHNEVNSFKTHVWRCKGICQNKYPYFGYVKRTANRPPGPNDLWWPKHQLTCCGEFVKIQEPEGYEPKKKKTYNEKPKDLKIPKITQFFSKQKSVGVQKQEKVLKAVTKSKKPPPKVTLDDFFKTKSNTCK
ncbi:unnamed protein product [Caenorhabditis angaria]|uniref:SprT-like domain-containing protein n=1 Tax=Caenorhabditis angaria TaxID=860376 RepID=A0A9P1N5Z2_9PELO|nr:unnamed protein product [Caenorhabditis angaria]